MKKLTVSLVLVLLVTALCLASNGGNQIEQQMNNSAIKINERIDGFDLDCSCESEGKINIAQANCASCGGRGYVTCSRCGGSGQIRTGTSSGSGGTKTTYGTCPSCGGAGVKVCSSCGGRGVR